EQVCYTNNLQTELEILQRRLADAEAKVSLSYDKFESQFESKKYEFEECLNIKDNEIKQVIENLEQTKLELETKHTKYEKVLQDKDTEISDLQKELKNVQVSKSALDTLVADLQTQVDSMESEKKDAITKVNDLEERSNEKDNKIKELQQILTTAVELNDKQINDSEGFTAIISGLQKTVEDKENEISNLKLKVADILESNQKERKEFEECQKESKIEMMILKDKLQNVIICKDELINDLKHMIAEKDSQVITLNVEVNKLAEEVLRLKDELTETHAELEIGQNELLNLKEEHDRIIDRNESNLALKNQELRALHDKINQLNDEKVDLLANNELLQCKLNTEKQVLARHIKEMEETQTQLNTDIDTISFEQREIENKLNSEIERLKAECEQLRIDKDDEVESLSKKMHAVETELNEQVITKDKIITKTMQNVEQLKLQLHEIEDAKTKDNEHMLLILSEKEKDYQVRLIRACCYDVGLR
ncbi:uncharacterized protein, partial [Epargyreus clarus]|uniref:uncharacterized protein n=1 Tax=Epargyreus clarus TaxID=520877 RepID=UPI003C2ACA00